MPDDKLDRILDEPRYKVCKLLKDRHVPSLLWFEDALHYHGVPTVLFELHLLVPDVKHAVDILSEEGWVPPGPLSSDLSNPFPSVPGLVHSRLVPSGWHEWPKDDFSWMKTPGGQAPPPKPPVVVLLPAEWWSISEEMIPTSDNLIPSLATLVDRLIADFLDAPDDTQYRDHLGVQVGYLYEYVPELKDTSFRKQLRHELQQFHLDCLAGVPTLSLRGAAHQRKVRDELAAGLRKLKLTSIELDDEDESMRIFYGTLFKSADSSQDEERK